MISPTKVAPLPSGQSGDDEQLEKTLIQHDLALAEHQSALAAQTDEVTTQRLPPELQQAVRVLCDTYEKLDLRIETTLGAAENDFLAALPEIQEHEAELRQFVALLINDLRFAVDGTQSQPVLLCLAFQDEDDLAQQLLSSLKTQGVEQ